jgi:CrcB protein
VPSATPLGDSVPRPSGSEPPRAAPGPVALRDLAAVSAGGALGAAARLGAGAALPHAAGAFAWSTLLVNVSGCLFIGVVMGLVTERWPRPLRPFLGPGVAGGYTTFSTHVADAHGMLAAGAPWIAAAYIGATLAGGLAAVAAGDAVARAVRRRRSAARGGGRSR